MRRSRLDIENKIDSAFNRGLTPELVPGTQNTWSNVIPPSNWANDPNPLVGASVTATIPAGNIALTDTDPYYFAVTAVNEGSGPNSNLNVFQSVPSNVVEVNVTGSNNSVALQWSATAQAQTATVSATTSTTVTTNSESGFQPAGAFWITPAGFGANLDVLFTYSSITSAGGSGFTFEGVAEAGVGPKDTPTYTPQNGDVIVADFSTPRSRVLQHLRRLFARQPGLHRQCARPRELTGEHRR